MTVYSSEQDVVLTGDCWMVDGGGAGPETWPAHGTVRQCRPDLMVSPGDGVSRVWTVCGARPGEQNSGRREERRRARAPHSRPCPGRAGRVSRRQPAVTAGLGLAGGCAGTSPACLPSSGWFSYSNTRLRLAPGTVIWQQHYQAKGTIGQLLTSSYFTGNC